MQGPQKPSELGCLQSVAMAETVVEHSAEQELEGV